MGGFNTGVGGSKVCCTVLTGMGLLLQRHVGQQSLQASQAQKHTHRAIVLLRSG
jgi:hypothetical protein